MKTELHIPSDLRFLPVVENWLLDFLKAELAEEVIWPQLAPRLRLALVEAYSNVVRHAHKDQPDIPVVLRLERVGDRILLEIWDSGEGYDTNEYLSPIPQNYQEGGYGWMILHRLMDTVQYHIKARGDQNCLVLQTHLPLLQKTL